MKNGWGRVYPTHVGGGFLEFFLQIYRLWFVGGKHCGEDVAGHDEGISAWTCTKNCIYRRMVDRRG